MNEEDGEGQRWISYLEIVKKPIPSIDEFIVGGGFHEDSNRIDAASELIETVHEVSHGGSLGWKNFWWKVSLSPAATSIYTF
jgi:hypothetical protein